MSSDGSITLVWGDGENAFRYGIGQWRELQEKINTRRIGIGLPAIGPSTLLSSLRVRDAWPDDIRDVLRIGLVGAGMSTKLAHRKLVLYFDSAPPFEHNLAAYQVLAAALIGPPEDEIAAKKKTTETEEETSLSASPGSTGQVQH